MSTYSPYPADLFTFANNQFTAGASQGIATTFWLRIRNPKTKGIACFQLVGEDKDASGEDVCGWKYKCVTPKLTHLTALIIND